jgi:hypothetical protein
VREDDDLCDLIIILISFNKKLFLQLMCALCYCLISELFVGFIFLLGPHAGSTVGFVESFVSDGGQDLILSILVPVFAPVIFLKLLIFFVLGAAPVSSCFSN